MQNNSFEKGEGYIKYTSKWVKKLESIDKNILREINLVRTKLMQLGYLGVLQNGIGYGNISVRIENSNQFYITGSATGGIALLDNSHLAKVEMVNLAKNTLMCSGLTVASSESMSHAVVYQCLPKVNAVIHIHNHALWTRHLNRMPTTNPNAEYGTQEMATSIENEINRLGIVEGCMVMGGHEDGILAFDTSLLSTLEQILRL